MSYSHRERGEYMYKIATYAAVFIVLIVLAFFSLREGVSPRSLLTSLKDKDEQFSSFSYWKEFRPASGKFQVTLPSTPRYVKDMIPVPNSDKKRLYEIYVSEKLDGTVFMISAITYPSEMNTEDNETILKGMVDELMLAQPESKLSALYKAEHQAKPAYNFDIDNNDFKIHGKTFLVGKTLYVLSSIFLKDNDVREEYDFFVDSFVLLPEKK